MTPESVQAFHAQWRIANKSFRDVRRDAVNELIDQIAGTVLTHLSGMLKRSDGAALRHCVGAYSQKSGSKSQNVIAASVR
jgi:hypothetical protein